MLYRTPSRYSMDSKRGRTSKIEPKRSERTDIRTIAEMANVSIATVSRTMNHVASVNPRMAKRVWEAINKLD